MSWFNKKGHVIPVDSLPQIKELFEEVSRLRNSISQICKHDDIELIDKGDHKSTQRLSACEAYTSKRDHDKYYRYFKLCNVCGSEESINKLEYMKTQKELLEISIKEEER